MLQIFGKSVLLARKSCFDTYTFFSLKVWPNENVDRKQIGIGKNTQKPLCVDHIILYIKLCKNLQIIEEYRDISIIASLLLSVLSQASELPQNAYRNYFRLVSGFSYPFFIHISYTIKNVVYSHINNIYLLIYSNCHIHIFIIRTQTLTLTVNLSKIEVFIIYFILRTQPLRIYIRSTTFRNSVICFAHYVI